MSFDILFVGDVNESFSAYVKTLHSDAELITSGNFKTSYFPSVGYTSLGDLSRTSELFDLCERYQKIFYCKINNEHLEKQTRRILNCIKDTKTIHNFDRPPVPAYITESFIASRNSSEPTMWTVGGSDIFGVGVNKNEKVGYLLQSKLGLDWIEIAEPAAGIEWCANQICLIDLKPGDIVFWGINTYSRITVIENSKKMHITPTNLHSIKNQRFFIDYFDSDLNFYNTYFAVLRAQKYCNANNVKLITIGTLADFDGRLEQLPLEHYKQSVYETYIDYGNKTAEIKSKDMESHPGIKQHQKFANDFLELYQSTQE